MFLILTSKKINKYNIPKYFFNFLTMSYCTVKAIFCRVGTIMNPALLKQIQTLIILCGFIMCHAVYKYNLTGFDCS